MIRLVVLRYARFPLSLRDVEDLLHERGIDLCHETVRLWWNRFRAGFCRRYPAPARANTGKAEAIVTDGLRS